MNTQALPRKVRPGPQSRYRSFPVIGPVLDDMLVWFRRQGYAESTIGNYLTAAGPLFRWLRKRRGPALRGLSQRDLTAAHDYFRKRRVDVTTASRAFARFLAEYRLISVERPEPPSRSERQLQLFGAYLHEVRGLAPASVIGQQVRLRPFLQFLKLDQRPFAIHRLKPDQIEAFLRQSSKTNNRFSLQHIVSSLRAFLRHQHAQGVLREPLYQRIDTARTYRLEQLPRALPWEQVTALLRSIDRSAPGALRDFTVLYLAVRYGLRSSELVHLTLDDIDWRAGTLKVTQTKTRQTLLLPLTNEAGDILARYLRDGRPRSEHRELFLRRVAPSGPLAPTAVHAILDKHRKAFGSLKLPVMGSHVPRHSLAVHLLRRGVRLPAIGAALGHRVPGSTAIYLRLATEDLREVGLPVPKGGKAAAMPEGNGWRGKLVPARASPRARAFRAGFHSELAASIRLYLETRRALGRAYVNEEYALRHWDNFLVRRNAKVRKATPEMFHAWAGTMPTLTPTVRRQRMLTVRNFLLFHARRRPSTAIPELSTFPRRGACQAVQPTLALLLLQRSLPAPMALAQLLYRADPRKLSNYAQRNPGGRNRQQGVQQQSPAVRRTQVSRPLSRRVVGQIDLRSVLSNQHHRVLHAPLSSLLGMAGKNLFCLNPRVVPESISGFRARPAQGLRATRLRMLCKVLDHPRQPQIESRVCQTCSAQFVPCPTHSRSPSCVGLPSRGLPEGIIT